MIRLAQLSGSKYLTSYVIVTCLLPISCMSFSRCSCMFNGDTLANGVLAEVIERAVFRGGPCQLMMVWGAAQQH